MPGRRELIGFALLAAVAAAAALTAPDRTLETLASLGDRPLQFAVLLAAVYLARPFAGWPVVAVSAVVGYVLGPALGMAVATAGVAVTSLPLYLAARWFGSGAGLAARLGDRGRTYFRTAGDVRGVVAARLLPIPSDAVSVAAGLSKVGPGAFLVGTVLGELPWTAAAVLVGASARQLRMGGLSSVGGPLAVVTTLAAVGLLAGPVYRRFAGTDASG